jgi:hypothetical protein
MRPCSSSASTLDPWVTRPPRICARPIEPPGFTLNAMAGRLTTTPLTSDSPLRHTSRCHSEPADRLAYLYPDGAVRMSCGAVKVGDAHRTGVNIESAGTLSECFDRRVTSSLFIDPKLTKPISLDKSSQRSRKSCYVVGAS